MWTLLFGDYTFPNQTFEVKKLPLDNEIRLDSIPRRHGAKIQTPYLKPRRISIEGYLHNNTVEATHDEFMALQEGLLAAEAAFQYRSDRSINCYSRRITTKMEKGTDKAVIKIGIELIAESPFFSSTGASYSTAEDASGTTHTFDVYNGGGVFSEPIISICATGGTITNDAQLENTTTDQLFKFTGVISNGLTLEIDSDELTVLNNALDGISLFEGDFITLDAGTNSFEYVGSDCRVTVEYKYRWY